MKGHDNKLLLKVKIEKTRDKDFQDKFILTYKYTIVLCNVTDGKHKFFSALNNNNNNNNNNNI